MLGGWVSVSIAYVLVPKFDNLAKLHILLKLEIVFNVSCLLWRVSIASKDLKFVGTCLSVLVIFL